MSVEQKRRAFITGASSGIGKAIALVFAKTKIYIAQVSPPITKLIETVVAKHIEPIWDLFTKGRCISAGSISV